MSRVHQRARQKVEQIRRQLAAKKPKPWRASWPLVRLNLNLMGNRMKEVVNEEARRRNITVEQATQEAIEIVRKLEYKLAEKIGTTPPIITVAGVSSLAASQGLLNYFLPKGKLPKDYNKMTKVEQRKILAPHPVTFFEAIVDPLAQAHPKHRATVYKENIPKLINDVFKRKTPNKDALQTIVHEFLEEAGRMPKGKHIVRTFTTKEEAELTNHIQNNFKQIFGSEYKDVRGQYDEERKRIIKTIKSNKIKIKKVTWYGSADEAVKELNQKEREKVKKSLGRTKYNLDVFLNQILPKGKAEKIDHYINLVTNNVMKEIAPRFEDYWQKDAVKKQILLKMLRQRSKK